jgi:hypothetical protein
LAVVEALILEVMAALAAQVAVQVNMLVTLFMVALELQDKVLQVEMDEILAMAEITIDSRAVAAVRVAVAQVMERNQTVVMV